MKSTLKPLVIFSVGALLGGCALMGGGEKPQPKYDESAGVAAQAQQFIEIKNKKANKNVTRVALTTCQVAFAVKQSGGSQTSGHIFDNRDYTVEAKVSQHYHLKGVTDAELQAITDRVCSQGEQQLSAAGFDVMPAASLIKTSEFQDLKESGKDSPLKFKVKSTEYSVFAPTGYRVTDEATANAGLTGGLTNAFKQMGGANPASKEATLAHRLGVTPARLMFVVDMASITENKKGLLGMNQTAMVEGKVNLQVGGTLMLVPPGKMSQTMPGSDKWTYGAHMVPTYFTKHALFTDEAFYSSVEDSTTTGDKVSDGITTALGYLSALGGGTGKKSKTSRYDVNVVPDKFSALILKNGMNFVDMAAYSAKQ
ncbi:hypothetical protein IB286_10530 [Spongiibacter sp. KMU-158]|uniref:Lipoprotein n=1 Tax=Spongiibacter pelagi TaxID=2760804 RepID=A0A927C1A9_9GAMM|nr:hypothetical protein [Spongiibacter pelagi]MBD2859439.1 hypothetical protein [Spongiibacter pelagi]